MQVGQRGSDKRLTVIAPFEDSPAWKAGLLPGDIITEIDGQPTGEDKLSNIVSRMKGEPGTPVTITVERPGYGTPMVYNLVRELITIQDLKFAGIIDGKQGLGYVRLTGFSGKATESLEDALKDLNDQGLRKLVLDLRGNPGGLLREAVGVADLFLPKGALIVETRGRDNEVLKQYYSDNDPLFDGELVVLVNQGSASASEIVSGAIQDLDRGVIVGETTYGKGLVQSVMSLDASSKVKLTTAKYYIPSGRLIQRIDYFDDNKVLYHDPEGDQADTLFHTTEGRLVVGGRGIQPDLEQEAEAWPFFVSELWRANLFINFLTDRERQGQPIARTKVDDALLDEFQTYIQAQEFTFKPSGSKELEELEKIIERESYGSPVAEALIGLRQKLEGDPEQHFAQNRQWIERLLTGEVLSRADGQDARTRHTLEYDRQFEAARTLLIGRGGLVPCPPAPPRKPALG
jgi:carboxyl-terminal processing protease